MAAEGWFADLVAKLHEKIGENRGGPDDRYWAALDDAVTDLADHGESIEEVGLAKLEELLRLVGIQQVSTDVAIASLRAATADEVIASVEDGTAALEEDTAAREKRWADLTELAEKLGRIGCQILLGAIIA